MLVINKHQLTQIYSQQKRDFATTHETFFVKRHVKGERIFYFLPRFGRPKYYTEDVFYELFNGGSYTRSKVNKKIKKEYDFGLYNLFEENGVIYRKPRVVFELPNDVRHYKYFDTIELCEEYIKELKNNNAFLIEI